MALLARRKRRYTASGRLLDVAQRRSRRRPRAGLAAIWLSERCAGIGRRMLCSRKSMVFLLTIGVPLAGCSPWTEYRAEAMNPPTGDSETTFKSCNRAVRQRYLLSDTAYGVAGGLGLLAGGLATVGQKEADIADCMREHGYEHAPD